jgi:hypothetical protein
MEKDFDPLEVDSQYSSQETPKKPKKLATRTLVLDLVHHVKLESEGQVCYLLNDGGNLKIVETVIINEKEYRPKQDVPFFCLTNTILDAEPIPKQELLNRTIAFLKRYIELPHKQLYLVVALYVGHTYFLEHFDTTPILNVYGVKETGKSRLGALVALISFRGERCTSPTEGTLFRAAQAFKSTLIIDEIKLWGRDGNRPVADLIKSRYKRGMKVARCDMNKSGEDAITFHDVFAPLTVCSTEKMPEIIKSRSITVTMRQNKHMEVEQDIDEEQAELLREQWTLQRFAWMNRELPNVKQIARRRLWEITKPLVQVCNVIDRSHMESLSDFIQYLEMEKNREETETTEFEILQTIVEHWRVHDRNCFRTREIKDKMNKGRNERDQLSDKYIFACIQRMGFEKATLHGNRKGFWYDKDLVLSLCEQYQLNDETGVSDPQEKGMSVDDRKDFVFSDLAQ